MALSFPFTLLDGSGFSWDINSDGSVTNGTNDAFDTGLSPNAGLVFSNSSTEDAGREIVLGPVIDGNFSIERKIYVSPTSGFVRYLEIVTNIGSAAGSYAVNVDTNLGSDSNTVALTSSGDEAFNVIDRWITTDDNNPGGGDPFVTLVLSGAGGASPTTASHTGDNVTYGTALYIPAGGTQIFMHFAAQNNSAAEALADANMLTTLGGDALTGMSAVELSQLANFAKVPITNLTIAGTSGDDVIFGGFGKDTLSGESGNDRISGGDNDDRISGANGNDIIYAGTGRDKVTSGAGNDFISGDDGDDILYGDAADDLVTSFATKTLPVTNEKLSISLTVPDASNGTTLEASGYVSRTPVTSEKFNIAFVIDVSGSTSASFSGTTRVGDLNGDGTANTVLDAEIAGFEKLVASISKQVGNNATISVIPFDSNSSVSFTGLANADANGNGRADVIDALRSFKTGSDTNFEAGLIQATNFFSARTEGQNLLYFLSDGANNTGGSFTDEVTRLISSKGLDVTVKSYGVGSGASETQLDLVDDNIDNDTATILLDPSILGTELIDPRIDRTDIARVEILVNGKVVKTIAGSALKETPLGLQYSFTEVLKGLNPTTSDKITARVIASDAVKTTVTTSQTVEALIGGDGSDVVLGGGGNDRISGGGGNDILDGGADDDRLSGGVGNDSLSGGLGSDVLSGGAGNDMLDGGASADQMDGGLGNDRYVIDHIGDKVTEAASAGTDTVHSSLKYTLGSNLENLVLTGDRAIAGTGNNLSNSITGNAAANVLHGMKGNDSIKGLAGKDTLYGDEGNDVLNGGASADKLIGGAGTDTASYAGATAGVTASLAKPSINSGDGKGDTFSSIENMVGSSFSDKLTGNTGTNQLAGGLGYDTLTGGAGRDSFLFNTSIGSKNVDTITDFVVADDIVHLAKSVFTKIPGSGVLTNGQFYKSNSGLAHDKDDRIVYETDTGKLYYDADGNGSGLAIQFATLSKSLSMTAADFYII